ncbi:hypothetical protein CLOP_g7851 [Closterium sp. NIES-67]|nr:hypothetical protein CLOP_g7851 [Closterium sp. NIES-67]
MLSALHGLEHLSLTDCPLLTAASLASILPPCLPSLRACCLSGTAVGVGEGGGEGGVAGGGSEQWGVAVKGRRRSKGSRAGSSAASGGGMAAAGAPSNAAPTAAADGVPAVPSSPSVISLLARAPHLTHLELGGMHHALDDSAFRKLTSLIHLRHLDMWGSSITDASAPLLLAFPRLLSANLSWTALSHVPAHPSLASLHLSHCSLLSIGYPIPSSSSSPSSSSPSSSQSASPSSSPLTHLVLSGSSIAPPSSLFPPHLLASITHLDISHSRGATPPPPPSHTPSHPSLPPPPHGPPCGLLWLLPAVSLTHLDLASAAISDTLLLHLAHSVPHTALPPGTTTHAATSSNTATSATTTITPSASTSLTPCHTFPWQHLSLASSPDLTSRGLAALLPLAPRLVSLSLAHTAASNACLPLLASLPLLSSLCLDGCPISGGTSDDGMEDGDEEEDEEEYLLRQHLAGLYAPTPLPSAAASAVAEGGLALLASLPLLTALSLLATPLSTHGMLRLRHLTYLHSLSLSSTALSPRRFVSLLAFCPCRHLLLSSPHITAHHLPSLRLHPSVRLLDASLLPAFPPPHATTLASQLAPRITVVHAFDRGSSSGLWVLQQRAGEGKGPRRGRGQESRGREGMVERGQGGGAEGGEWKEGPRGQGGQREEGAGSSDGKGESFHRGGGKRSAHSNGDERRRFSRAELNSLRRAAQALQLPVPLPLPLSRNQPWRFSIL